MNKAILTARRLVASAVVQDDARRLADAVGQLQDRSVAMGYSKSQDMSEGVPRKDAPQDMAAEADRLSAAGLGIRWPLDATEILKALNSYIAEPEGQLLLEVGGEAIAPSPPRKLCEACGEPGGAVECDNCGEKQILCRECSDTATEEDGGEVEVCSECADDLKRCSECDGLIYTDSEIQISGDDYCATCAEEASNCDDCGDREFGKDMTYIESSDKSVCESCKDNYGYCEGCNEHHSDDDMHFANDMALCDDCYNKQMVSCEECGEDILTEDANCDDEGAYYCSDCYTGGNLHADATDLGVDFDRGVGPGETPLAERLGMLLRLMGDRGRMPISQLKKSHPGLAAAIMADLDINRLADGNTITKELAEAARDGVEETYEGLRVSLGEWGGGQRLYDKDNIVFRLDVRDVIDEMESRDGSADEGSQERAAVNLLEAAAAAGMGAHPIMPKSTIGWARVVRLDDDTWYIEELQSDFDAQAGRIRRYVKEGGKTVTLPSGVSAEDVRLGWPLVSDLLDNWEQHLLAKLANIARENGVKTLAVISKAQLDAWRENPPPSAYSTSGKTRSDTKRKRYYRDAPKSMGFSLEDAELGGLKQKVWLRAASRDGLFERMARLAAFEASLGLDRQNPRTHSETHDAAARAATLGSIQQRATDHAHPVIAQNRPAHTHALLALTAPIAEMALKTFTPIVRAEPHRVNMGDKVFLYRAATMPNRAAIIARRILKRAYGGPVLLFDHDGSFAKLSAEGETVRAGGDIASAVDGIYGGRLPGTITLRSGSEPEHPGQRRLFDTGEDDERFKSVRERPEPHTTVLSVEDTGAGIHLTVVSSDWEAAENDEFIESVIEKLHEKEVHPPWESGDGLSGNVEAYLDHGGEIPSEFYEDRYNWDKLIEPLNEFWYKEFKDDVRKAVEELLDDDDISLHGASFPAGESIGEVVMALAAGGLRSVMSPDEVAEELSDSDEFRGYEERGYEGVDEITGPIVEEIREIWKSRQMMKQDDEKFDAMRKSLDAPVELPPNSDAVLRLLGAFKEEGWDAMSFRELAEEMPWVARQERFWKAVAKGSPKLTPDRLQAYLDGKNPKATDALPKSFGGKAVNPPKYRVVAEKDYEGYTISNVDEHMLGVAALYVEDMNEPNRTPRDPATGLQPNREPIYYQIMDAMKKWHVGAHPLSDASKGVGWIRYDLIEDDGESVMFIQEIQSDFMWAIELAAAGKTPHLGGGFPDSWYMCPDCGTETERRTVEDNSGQGGDYTEIWCPKCSEGVDDDAELATQRKLAQYILKKFQGWDHYLLGNLMTTARQNGVDRVVMNTSKTVKLNPASAPKSKKKLKWYDELARDFGFGQEQTEMYGHDEEFHSRAAGRMAYHAAWRIISASA